MKTRNKLLLGLIVLLALLRFAFHMSVRKSADTSPRTPSMTEVNEAIANGDVLDVLRDPDEVKETRERMATQRPVITETEVEEAAPKTEKPAALSLRGELLELMSNDDIEGVLAQLKTPEVERLNAELEKANMAYKSNTISFDEWAIERNKINIDLFPLLPTDDKVAIKTIARAQVKDLLNAGEVEKAVDLLVAAGYDEMVKAKARLVRANKAFQNGIIKTNDLNVIYARVREYLHYTF